jgi:hypothetical protein
VAGSTSRIVVPRDAAYLHTMSIVSPGVVCAAVVEERDGVPTIT